jgi:hypothetical protein
MLDLQVLQALIQLLLDPQALKVTLALQVLLECKASKVLLDLLALKVFRVCKASKV